MKKLLILDSHPVQYRAPVYRILNKLLSENAQKLIIVYSSNSSIRGSVDKGFGQKVIWDEPLLESYDSHFLPEANFVEPGSPTNLKGQGLIRLLNSIKPDVIYLNGIYYIADLKALLWAKTKGIPVWLRSETQDLCFARSALKQLIRGCLYKGIYRLIDHFFPIGTLNKNHYLVHGVPLQKLTTAFYGVADKFEKSETEREILAQETRNKLGINGEVTALLFCGKLIKKKAPSLLLEAIALLPAEERKKYTVIFVGSGELDTKLRSRASELDVQTMFIGFVNQTEIAAYYLAADALVLPSQQMGETWGLVANEAILAGRPALISRHAGSSQDLGSLLGVVVFEPTPAGLAEELPKVKNLPRGDMIRNQMTPFSLSNTAQVISDHFQKFVTNT
jgi:glycosyltransferase involved in cell wall biosynthesis